MTAVSPNEVPIVIDGDDVEVPATPHRIELGVPDDEERLLLRVWLDSEWSGDLLFTSRDARSAFLDALTAGEISVTRLLIPLTDVYPELEITPPTQGCPPDQDKELGG